MEADNASVGRPEWEASDLLEDLSRRIVGQPSAIQCIVPHIRMYQAGLSPADRPAGIFLLLGPTGTGKTRTVEALAEILHGSPKHLLKIDCAEYQSDHEVAKLIGAPPGYVGHRETKPLLTQERLTAVTTDGCDLALVLFDEIEKASQSLTALLLGVLDRATLRLGDNTTVNFEKTLIFLTSNLGARDMLKASRPEIGFQPAEGPPPSAVASRLENIGVAAVRKRFSPEFVNRIDAVITYQPLDSQSLAEILDYHIGELQRHVHTRLAERSFTIEVTDTARQLLQEKGSSQEYGARELKRTIHRMLTQPLAGMVAAGRVTPGGTVVVDAASTEGEIELRLNDNSRGQTGRPTGAVLVVDDNQELLEWSQHVFAGAGAAAFPATTAEEAREAVLSRPFDLAVLDVMLPDGDGLSLAFELLRMRPHMQIVMMTGMELTPDEISLCERQNFPILRKPFLSGDLLTVAKAGLSRSAVAGA